MMTNSNPAPRKNMDATIQIGSDFWPARVCRVSPSGKTVTVAWTHPNHAGRKQTFRLSKWGQYRAEQHYVLRLGSARLDLDEGR